MDMDGNSSWMPLRTMPRESTASAAGDHNEGHQYTVASTMGASQTLWRGRDKHRTRVRHQTRLMTLRPDYARRQSQGAQLGYSGHMMAEKVGRKGTRERAITEQIIEEAVQHGQPVKAAHLKDAGLSMEELANAVYDTLIEEDLPNFLEKINLDQDGGLDRIAILWDRQKIFWFFFLLLCVAFNVALLFGMNYTIFQSYIALGVSESVAMLQHKDSGDANQASLEAAEAQALSADIFSHIRDPWTRRHVVTIAAAVATFEVLWMFVYLVAVAHHVYVFKHGNTEYKCYMAILTCMQWTLPTLSTFSAIKLFARVHPSLLYQEYFEFLQESWCRSHMGHSHAGVLASTVWFVTTRLLCAITAVSAYAVKLLAVGLKLVSPQYGIFIRGASVFALLAQSMGCVLFEQVLQNRVFLFVFGGSDSEFRDDELALRNVYQCRVAKQIWETYWDATWEGRFKAIVSLTTLDHYDLQRLLIEDIDLDEQMSYLETLCPEESGGEAMFGAERTDATCRSSYTSEPSVQWNRQATDAIPLQSLSGDIRTSKLFGVTRTNEDAANPVRPGFSPKDDLGPEVGPKNSLGLPTASSSRDLCLKGICCRQ